jgi:hypothetical protein
LTELTALGRVLFTRDKDFLIEATRRQKSDEMFADIIFAHQLKVSVSECIDDLELIAQASEPDEWKNRLEYLPLK